MRPTLVQALVLAASLMGCASVPTLRGSPEDVANQIGGNAVAYNQAYGRAIADQVLLNVLRARDRLPLYHLSMSGIGDSSELATSGGFTINQVSLGDGDGGVGEITGSRTLTTKPTYTLNPFSHDGEHPGGLPFEQVPPEFLKHFWDNQWPRDVLLLVMVDAMTKDRTRYINSASSYRDNCTGDPAPAGPNGVEHIRGAGCLFLDEVDEIIQDPRADLSSNCRPWPARAENQPQRPRQCDPTITVRNRVYHLHLRALDDMIYYVGGLLRVPSDASGAASARVLVRPTGLYSDDTLPAAHRPWVSRSAPLFRITETPRRRRNNGAYAAEISYQGRRYVAGPSISANCVVGETECVVPHEGDRSAQVLSLLTQLIVLTQSDAAQRAPERVLTR